MLLCTLKLERYERDPEKYFAFQNQFLGSNKVVVQVLVIEVNTVPGMTPSTVLIQQVTFAFLSDQSCNRFSFCVLGSMSTKRKPKKSFVSK